MSASPPPSPYPPVPQGPPGQGAHPAPTKPSRKWLPWALGGCGCLALIALAIVALIAGIAILGGNGPEDAVRNYQTAWDESDCELFFQTTTEDYQDGATCADFEEAVASGGLGEYEILDSEIDGDNAWVTTREEATVDGSTVSSEVVYDLVRIDGDWRIDGHRFEGE